MPLARLVLFPFFDHVVSGLLEMCGHVESERLCRLAAVVQRTSDAGGYLEAGAYLV